MFFMVSHLYSKRQLNTVRDWSEKYTCSGGRSGKTKSRDLHVTCTCSKVMQRLVEGVYCACTGCTEPVLQSRKGVTICKRLECKQAAVSHKLLKVRRGTVKISQSRRELGKVGVEKRVG